MVLHSFDQILTRARETGLNVVPKPVLTSEILDKEAVRLKHMTLLLADDRFSADDIKLFRKNYPFPFEDIPIRTTDQPDLLVHFPHYFSEVMTP